MYIIDLLEVERLVKLTVSGRLFHTLMTLQTKALALALLHLTLYNLYALHALWWTTEETQNSRKTPV